MKYSLHFGLNRVDPDHYAGWDGQLMGCKNDATDLSVLFARLGYQPKVFFDSSCTIDGFRNRLLEIAGVAAAGDQVVISYSGHGGQKLGIQSEDLTVETFCMFDGELLDVQFLALLAKFATSVQVVCILDSCHSGGMDRALRQRRVRAMPRSVQQQVGATVDKSILGIGRPGVSASTLMLAACTRNQLAEDGDGNGAFTGSMLKTFKVGATWGDWFKDTANRMSNESPDQTPVWHLLGPVTPDVRGSKA